MICVSSQDSPARATATYANTRITENPELRSRALNCCPWRESSARNSTCPSPREPSFPAPSASQRHKWRFGFRTAGQRPRDCRRPSWRNSSWQPSRCCRPSPSPSPWAHPWAHRPSMGLWMARDLPYRYRDYSVDPMGCTTFLNTALIGHSACMSVCAFTFKMISTPQSNMFNEDIYVRIFIWLEEKKTFR